MSILDKKQMFKVIIQNDEDKKRILYTLIDMGDFNHARPNLHKAIKERIEPGFFTPMNSPNDYELFWVDDENDIILIKSWWDMHNYASYLAPQGKKYVKLYVKPTGHQDRIEAMKNAEARHLKREHLQQIPEKLDFERMD